MSLDRYYLAVAFMERQPDAHEILADMLEESGERGLANWARGKNRRHASRLGLVLEMFPPSIALALALDFVHPILELDGITMSFRRRMRRAVKKLRQGPNDAKSLTSVLPALNQGTWGVGRTVAQYLHALVASVRMLQEQHQTMDECTNLADATEQRRHARHSARSIHLNLRHLAMQVRLCTHAFVRTGFFEPHLPHHARQASGTHGEVYWQMHRTKEVIRALVWDDSHGDLSIDTSKL